MGKPELIQFGKWGLSPFSAGEGGWYRRGGGRNEPGDCWPGLGWEGRAGVRRREGSVLGNSPGPMGERGGPVCAGSGVWGQNRGLGWGIGGQGDREGDRQGGVLVGDCGVTWLWGGDEAGDTCYM